MLRSLLAAGIAALALSFAPAAAAWSWPYDGPVVRAFVLGGDPYAGGQHRGIDIGGSVGDVVRAAAAGTVTFAGSVPGGGRVVTVRSSDGYAVTLLQLGELRVAENATVAEGQVVGTIGASSDAVTTSPHVHLGIRPAADPDGYVDPLTLLPARSQPAAGPSPSLSSPAPAPSAAPAPTTVTSESEGAAPAPADTPPTDPLRGHAPAVAPSPAMPRQSSHRARTSRPTAATEDAAPSVPVVVGRRAGRPAQARRSPEHAASDRTPRVAPARRARPVPQGRHRATAAEPLPDAVA